MKTKLLLFCLSLFVLAVSVTGCGGKEQKSSQRGCEKFFHGMFLLYVISILSQIGTCVKSAKPLY